MDQENNENEENEGNEENFAELLEASLKTSAPLTKGQKVEAEVLQITDDWVFLDVGQKGEGVLDKKELLDAEGNLSLAVGDTLQAYFLSRSAGELRFTTKIGGRAAGAEQLEEAWRSGIPVDGQVQKEIKGGFEVRLPGNVRAFCPYSQMSLRRVDNPEAFLEQNFSFKISKFEERGRNIVVSHRAILEEERQKQKDALKETLSEGMTVTGTITQLQKFGAFVDIGGIEGLIPVSEIGWGRIEDISEVLSVGQQVEAVAMKLDWEQDRFSFSLKQAMADPWQTVAEKYPEPGIDGLVHISKLGAGKRINHPREVVNEEQAVQVRIEKLDLDERRISLALAAGAGEEAAEAGAADYRQYLKEKPAAGMGTLGDLLKAKLDKGKE